MNRKILLFAFLLTLGLTMAAPLQVDIMEHIAVNATVDGVVSPTYSTSYVGYINITNNDASDTFSDVWVAINLSSSVINNTQLNALQLVANTTNSTVTWYNDTSVVPAKYHLDTTGATHVIHIPNMPAGRYVTFKYLINTTSGLPITVTEYYEPNKIIANANQTWMANLTLYLNTSIVSGNLNVNVTKVLSNNSSAFGSENWTVLYLINDSQSQGGVYISNSPYTGANGSLHWENITLNASVNSSWITFNVTGNNNATNTTLQRYGYAVINFVIENETLSRSKGIDVAVIGPANLSAVKGQNTSNASNWNESAIFYNSAGTVTYNLTQLDVWAVHGEHPSQVSPNASVIAGSQHSTTPNVYIAAGNSYMINNTFSFEGVPVVWANASYKLINSETQGFWIYNKTEGGNEYYVIEEIYIVNGYLIKITKHIVPQSNNTYDVYLVVENLGGLASPYVYVYDLIPNNFTIVSNSMYLNQSVMLAQHANNNNSLNYTGKNTQGLPAEYTEGYYWALYPISPNANGDGSYTDGAEITNNQTVVIHYQVQGSGVFKAMDAFIVGIDPTHSLLSQTTPYISLIGGSQAKNLELALVVLSVIVGVGLIVLVGKK